MKKSIIVTCIRKCTKCLISFSDKYIMLNSITLKNKHNLSLFVIEHTFLNVYKSQYDVFVWLLVCECGTVVDVFKIRYLAYSK